MSSSCHNSIGIFDQNYIFYKNPNILITKIRTHYRPIFRVISLNPSNIVAFTIQTIERNPMIRTNTHLVIKKRQILFFWTVNKWINGTDAFGSLADIFINLNFIILWIIISVRINQRYHVPTRGIIILMS